MSEDNIDVGIDEDMVEPLERVRAAPGRRPGRRPAKSINEEPNRLRRAGRPEGVRQLREPAREEDREEERAPLVGRLTRNKRMDRSDRFRIDKAMIPPGVSYEWKREITYGMHDPVHMIGLRENHWSPVPASRHPELVGPGVDSGPVRRDGMILMERPAYLTNEARREDYQEALNQVRGQEANIQRDEEGQFPREHPRARAHSGIKKTYGPVEIPED